MRLILSYLKKYKLLALLLAFVMLPACTSQDMSIVDQNGKTIHVASDGKDTYTFKLPSEKQTELSSWDNPFIDVTESDWFYKSVRYCHENRLVRGTTENTYSPSQPTSRAMIVSILWRLEGSPDTGTAAFTDVPANQYYADAVAWAASEGIVSGYSEDTFAPEQAITREQMASILYRYAEYHHWDTTITTMLDRFTDAHTASAYAEDALSWAASHGIISGMEDNLLTPYGEATRAQVAAILMNLCENFAI